MSLLDQCLASRTIDSMDVNGNLNPETNRRWCSSISILCDSVPCSFLLAIARSCLMSLGVASDIYLMKGLGGDYVYTRALIST